MNKMNSKIFLNFLIVQILTTALVVSAQNIYPLDKSARCEPYIGDSGDIKCAGRLANQASIYVTANRTQQNVMAELQLYFNFLTISTCKNDQNALKTVCSFGFQECVEFKTDTNETLAFPKRTCLDNCVSQMDTCGLTGIYDVCSLKEPSGVPSFPKVNSIYDLSSFNGPSNYSVECLNPFLIQVDSSAGSLGETCTYPFSYVNSTDHEADFIKGYFFIQDSNCVAPCPPPLYSNKKWDQIYTMSEIISCISFVSTFFLLFTFGVLNKNKTRYDKKNLFFLASNFFMALSGVIITANGTKKTLCPEPNRFGASNDSVCVASAFMLHMFAIYAIEWWSIMAFDLWWNIKFVNRKLNWDKYYIVVTTVIAVALPLICLGKKEYHSGLGNTLCWIKHSEYQDGTFFAPLGAALSLGTVFIILVLYEIFKIITRSAANHSLKTLISLEIKPFLNVLLFYTTFLYLFIFEKIITSNFKKYEASVGDYFICISTSDDPDNCFIMGPSVASLGYFTFCLRIYGIYCFFLYGLSKRNLTIWKESWVCQNKGAQYLANKLSSLSSWKTSTTVQTESGVTGTTSQGYSSSMSVGINDDNL